MVGFRDGARWADGNPIHMTNTAWPYEKELRKLIDSLEQENKILREGLEFYSGEENWHDINKLKPAAPILKMAIAALDTETDKWIGGKSARDALTQANKLRDERGTNETA